MSTETSTQHDIAVMAWALHGHTFDGLDERHLRTLSKHPSFAGDIDRWQKKKADAQRQAAQQAATATAPPPRERWFFRDEAYGKMEQLAKDGKSFVEAMDAVAEEYSAVPMPMGAWLTIKSLVDFAEDMNEKNKQRNEAIARLEERCAALETRSHVKYCGVWASGEAFGLGDAVTHAGSLWISKLHHNKATPAQDGGVAWQLAVKRGADGRDGKGRDVMSWQFLFDASTPYSEVEAIADRMATTTIDDLWLDLIANPPFSNFSDADHARAMAIAAPKIRQITRDNMKASWLSLQENH